MTKIAGEITLKYSKELSTVSKRCRRRQEKLRQDRQAALQALEAAQPALTVFQTAAADAQAARDVAYATAKTDQADAEEAARLQDYQDRAAADAEYWATTHVQEYQAKKADIELDYSHTLKSINKQSRSLDDRQKARQKARNKRRAALDKVELELEKAKQARYDKWQRGQATANEKHIKAIETARRKPAQAVTAADRAYEQAVDAASDAYQKVLKKLPEVAAIVDEFALRRQKAETTCRQRKRDVRERMKAELAALNG